MTSDELKIILFLPVNRLRFAGVHVHLADSPVPSLSSFTGRLLSTYDVPMSDAQNKLSYFTIGSFGLLSASVAKSTVTEFLGTMSASSDVLALAKVEVDIGNIPAGRSVIVKWRGKPVFVRHRTTDEIMEARSADWQSMRDPESDEHRTKRPEWLVMLGVCTHLGCVPIGEAGDYGGW